METGPAVCALSVITHMNKSLPIPAPAKRDPRAVEMVRTWIAEGKLHVALNIGFWEQPKRGIDERDAWGIPMADMVRHIANAHEEEYGRDPRETLVMIRDAFEREIEKPTSAHIGKFTKRRGAAAE
jgi:hypothetical protein